MKDLRQRLLAVFRTEHREHLERIRSLLAHLGETGAAGAELDEVFRRAHSLKGAARAVDAGPVEELAHRLESLFARIREGALALEPRVVAAIHQALDATEDWSGAAEGAPEPESAARARAALEAVLGGPDGRPSTVDRRPPMVEGGPPPEDESPSTVHGPPPTVHSGPPVDQGGPTAEDERPSTVGRPRSAAGGPGSAAGGPPSPVPGRPSPAPAESDTLRVRAEALDAVLRSTGRVITEGQRQEAGAAQLEGLARRIGGLDREWEDLRRSSGAALRQLAQRPEHAALARFLERMDQELGELAGEARGLSHAEKRSAWDLRHAGDQLERDVRRARMVPAGEVLEGFGRMVREIARESGKEAELRADGLDVEADRRVLQSLRDPLMHLLRNAVSHGIETPEERERLGKPRAGRIDLQVAATGAHVEVTVDDDGGGLDLARVAEAAERRGLVAPGAASSLSPEELARLVFLPGFSTASAIGRLAGRGMGMSVVQEAVDALRGEVRIVPCPGTGARVVLRVPIALAAERLLLVGCGGARYALPFRGIERLLRARLADLPQVEGAPAVRYGDRTLPLASLANLVSDGEATLRAESDSLAVVLLRSGDRLAAVVVETLHTPVDGLVQDLGAPLNRSRKVLGGVLLADGTACAVLNPAELVEAARDSAVPLQFRTESAEVSAREPAILVVDDSITTRTLEKSILEAHGYRVRVAVDGVEALRLLQSERIDLIVTDVEMPRLDGFGLLEAVRRDPQLARLPVIIVSSLERAEHKERGLALGADAYVVKRKFDQRELLDTIRTIL